MGILQLLQAMRRARQLGGIEPRQMPGEQPLQLPEPRGAPEFPDNPGPIIDVEGADVSMLPGILAGAGTAGVAGLASQMGGPTGRPEVDPPQMPPPMPNPGASVPSGALPSSPMDLGMQAPQLPSAQEAPPPRGSATPLLPPINTGGGYDAQQTVDQIMGDVSGSAIPRTPDGRPNYMDDAPPQLGDVGGDNSAILQALLGNLQQQGQPGSPYPEMEDMEWWKRALLGFSEGMLGIPIGSSRERGHQRDIRKWAAEEERRRFELQNQQKQLELLHGFSQTDMDRALREFEALQDAWEGRQDVRQGDERIGLDRDEHDWTRTTDTADINLRGLGALQDERRLDQGLNIDLGNLQARGIESADRVNEGRRDRASRERIAEMQAEARKIYGERQIEGRKELEAIEYSNRRELVELGARLEPLEVIDPNNATIRAEINRIRSEYPEWDEQFESLPDGGYRLKNEEEILESTGWGPWREDNPELEQQRVINRYLRGLIFGRVERGGFRRFDRTGEEIEYR